MWWDFGGIVPWFIISSGYFAQRNAVTLNICFYIWGVNISKGQSNEICYFRFFHRWTHPKPLTRNLKTFRNLASNLKRYSRFLIDFLLLFMAESRYSPYCLIQRVVTLLLILAESLFVRINCINSRLLFNTESRYSPVLFNMESHHSPHRL